MNCYQILKKLMIFSILIFISSCASRGVFLNYAPTSLLKKSGKVQVSKFHYIPYEEKMVEDNEIELKGILDISLSTPVAEFVENALRLEFKFVGIEYMGKDAPLLTGSINQFYSESWMKHEVYLDITYKVTIVDKICFEKSIHNSKDAPGNSQVDGLIPIVLKENIETLLSNNEFLKCIKK